MKGALLRFVLFVLAGPAAACETALLLAVDISGSIDAREYQLQMSGLAEAIKDPEVAAALVDGQVALSLVHWSGYSFQQSSLPWTRMKNAADVAEFAEQTRNVLRPRDYTDTAIGQAILYSLGQFAEVSDCPRAVIDISGDGEENVIGTLPEARAAAEALGVTINAIAIELNSRNAPLTAYFRREVITQGGFVITARGLEDYARAIREKLRREVAKSVS